MWQKLRMVVGGPKRGKADNQGDEQGRPGGREQRQEQAGSIEEEDTNQGQRHRGRRQDGGAGVAKSPQEVITILYTNAQSVQGKISELSALAEDAGPDIILLTETWCNATVDNAVLAIPGYILATDLRRDRIDTANGIGGGLLVYGKEGIEILMNDNLASNFNQYCSFRITTRSTPLNFVLAYRPPSSRQENTVELCNLLRKLDSNTLVIGDINLPDIDWKEGRAGAKGRQLLETALEENLDQMVSFPTHRKGNMLDLIITNCPEKVLTVLDGGSLGKSDHCIILAEVECDIRYVDG
jgi:hypothetical protein